MVAKTYALFAVITIWSIVAAGGRGATVKTAKVATGRQQTGVAVSPKNVYPAADDDDGIIDYAEDDDDEEDDDDDDDDDEEEDYDDLETENELIEMMRAVEWLTAFDGGTIDEVSPYFQELFELQKAVDDDIARNVRDFSALYTAWAEFVRAPWGTEQQLLRLAYYQRLFARYAVDRERLRADTEKLRDLETALLPSTAYPHAEDITDERMKLAFALAEKDELMAAVETSSALRQVAAADVNARKDVQDGRSLFPETDGNDR